jgi:hypothetical protein
LVWKLTNFDEWKCTVFIFRLKFVFFCRFLLTLTSFVSFGRNLQRRTLIHWIRPKFEFAQRCFGVFWLPGWQWIFFLLFWAVWRLNLGSLGSKSRPEAKQATNFRGKILNSYNHCFSHPQLLTFSVCVDFGMWKTVVLIRIRLLQKWNVL